MADFEFSTDVETLAHTTSRTDLRDVAIRTSLECEHGCPRGRHTSRCNESEVFLFADGSITLVTANGDRCDYPSLDDARADWGDSPWRAGDSENEWAYRSAENALAAL